jgi:4-hydroxy-2-oxoheptanedioate aldolase
VFASSGSALVVEAVAATGAEVVVLDRQHGVWPADSLVSALQALAAYPVLRLVRTPLEDVAAIEQALDAGADGVVVPAVECRAQAEQVLAHCRYPTDGVRSLGPTRADLEPGGLGAVLTARPVCLAMIETVAGLEAVAEICGTPGLDGIFVGPADLAMSLGLPPSLAPVAGPHADAISTILDTAHRHDLLAGIHAATGAMAAQRSAEGFDLVTASSDLALLRWAVRKTLGDAAPATSAG